MKHSDDFAIACQVGADKFMDKSSDMIADVFSKPLGRINKKDISAIDRQLAISIAGSLREASAIAEEEIESNSVRSYALADAFKVSASDFYSKYIPLLSGNLTARAMLLIGNKIKKGEQEGLSDKEIAENLSNGFGLKKGYARVVVRTEGTRAASFSRRTVAYRAAARGRSPLRFIYKSLMDDRNTQVCKALNNRWWLFGEDDISYWPPQHYFCRSGVIFDWSAEEDLANMRKFTKSERARALNLQHAQFPNWINQSSDILLDPNKSYKDLLNTVNGGDRSSNFALSDMNKKEMTDRIIKIAGAEKKIVEDVQKILMGNRRNSKVSAIIRERFEMPEEQPETIRERVRRYTEQERENDARRREKEEA